MRQARRPAAFRWPVGPSRWWPGKLDELLKFAVTGALCWVADTGVVYTLKLTVLGEKPLTARVIGVVVATLASYGLNREWSFRTRGGRPWRSELTLFLVCSAIGVALTVLPQAVSLYLLGIRVPRVGPATQALANFFTGQVLGVLLATGFRFWAFRRFVFPEADARDRNGGPAA
ncbi:GtrA family protein [Amycolatopsis ponsaeliensis]|uniref:GtrA family protein n=1 Tax=Amycolatopsis ponsaeliensis TaxID=2992142 RepID=UPI003D9C409E